MDLQHIALPLVRARGWITFLAVVAFINGALNVLSIWGIIIAWLPIWIGVLLVQASNGLSNYELNGEEEDMREALEKIALVFKITAVWFIVTIALVVLVVVFFFSAVAAVFGGALSS